MGDLHGTQAGILAVVLLCPDVLDLTWHQLHIVHRHARGLTELCWDSDRRHGSPIDSSAAPQTLADVGATAIHLLFAGLRDLELLAIPAESEGGEGAEDPHVDR